MANTIWQRLLESTEEGTVTVRIPRSIAEELLSALSMAVDSEGDDDDGDIELDLGPPDGDAGDDDDGDDAGFGGLLIGSGDDDDDEDDDEDDDDKKEAAYCPPGSKRSMGEGRRASRIRRK